MSDSASWYQRKMASLRGGQAAPPVPQQRIQQYAQPQYPQQPQARPQVQQYQAQSLPPVTMDNLYQAMGHWRGGKAHQIDSEPCPECGSNQYYSRTDGKRRGPPPAPHCYNCGYNGMFQQGDPTTWGVV
jgi:hypothetical protein